MVICSRHSVAGLKREEKKWRISSANNSFVHSFRGACFFFLVSGNFLPGFGRRRAGRRSSRNCCRAPPAGEIDSLARVFTVFFSFTGFLPGLVPVGLG